MDLKELIIKKNELQAKLGEIENQKSPILEVLVGVEAEIQFKIAEPIKHARIIAGKDTGTIDCLIDGVMCKHQIDKKVVWDSAKMAEIYARIQAAGDDPENYMTVKTTHTVKEKAFENCPAPVREIFAEAREVKTGAPKISFDLNWRA